MFYLMKEQQITKTWLTSEVKFFLSLTSGIVVAVWGVAVPYFQIRQDIALIKQNHLTHIENIENEIKDLREEHNKQDQMYIDLLKAFSENK